MILIITEKAMSVFDGTLDLAERTVVEDDFKSECVILFTQDSATGQQLSIMCQPSNYGRTAFELVEEIRAQNKLTYISAN